MNIYDLKINSVHRSSAKRLCPNARVLESLILIIYFEKALLGLFLMER